MVKPRRASTGGLCRAVSVPHAVGSKQLFGGPSGSVNVTRAFRAVIVVVIKIDFRIASRFVLMGLVVISPDPTPDLPVWVSCQNEIYMIAVNVGISEAGDLQGWWKVLQVQDLRVSRVVGPLFLNHGSCRPHSLLGVWHN